MKKLWRALCAPWKKNIVVVNVTGADEVVTLINACKADRIILNRLATNPDAMRVLG